MTNTVTPKITTTAEIWFDPVGGSDKPTKVLFSVTQTDAGTFPYAGGGTITRDRTNISLFRDEQCTQPLVFSEGQARVTNAELLNNNVDTTVGLIAWIKGTESSLIVGTTTKLALKLDRLERSERKKTDFTTLAKTNTIDVDNADPGASAALTIKAAGTATPTLVIGGLDDASTRVFADAPTPVMFGFTEVVGESGTHYDGNGELALDPGVAKLLLFKDQPCTDAVVITAGKATIASGDLNTRVFYMKAAGDAVPASVKLTLTLLPATDPKKFVPQRPLTKAVALARVNKVTASLLATIPEALEDTVWFPSPVAVDPPSIALQVAQTQQADAPYAGDGVLTRNQPGIELFRDKALTQPLPFLGNAVVIANAELVGQQPLTLYVAGTAAGDVQLTLTLYDPKQRWLEIGGPKQVTLTAKPVNQVAVKLAYGGIAVPGRVAPASIFITQSNLAAAAYEKNGTLRRASADLMLFTGQEASGAGRDPVFVDNSLTASLLNAELGKADKVYYLGWQGTNPPLAASTAGLTLELPASAKPYVVTDSATQLRPAVALPPVAPIGGSTTVTPKIETEYDLVLLATGETKPETRTSPTRARFYVERGTPAVAYLGDATLTRDNPKLRVFFDAECTVEMNFSSANVAVIPNAALLVKDTIYYLRGVEAGKVKLTLTPAKPAAGFGSLPPVLVAAAATKDLAVVAVDLTIFRDAGEARPDATSNTVALTKGEQRRRGRFVHVQSAGKYGRAKLVLKKVETGDWPGSADQHQVWVSLTESSDRIRLYKGETSTDLWAKLAEPAKLDKGAVGSDVTLWAEGHAVSDDVNDVRIDVGIGRTDASGFTETKPLANGDWAVMTSVKITEVKPSAADWKQFVNLPPDHTKANNDNSDAVKNGRNILVTARLDPPKANIGVDFMLWGFKNNGDADQSISENLRVPRIPDALKAEKSHVTSVSSGAGLASARIELSRYGGDKFYAVAFLADDAAKGETELGKKGDTAPDSTKSKRIEVWQKIFYTLAAMKRYNAGNYEARANLPTFQAELERAFIEARQPQGAATVLVDHQPTTTIGQALALPALPAPAERTVNIGLVDIITHPSGPTQSTFALDSLSGTNVSWTLSGLYDPTNTGTWLVPSSGVLKVPTQPDIALPDNCFTLAYSGAAKYTLTVDIAAQLPSGVDVGTVIVRLTILSHDGLSGFSSGTKVFVAVRTREQSADDPTISCVHTMHHEVGHSIGLTSQKVPDPTQTLNRYWYRGALGGPTNYNILSGPTVVSASNPAEIGVGGHCKYDRTDFDAARVSANKLPDNNPPQCIMFHSLTSPPTAHFCANCVHVLRGRDLSSPPVGGTDDF